MTAQLPPSLFTAEVVAGAVSNRIVVEGELARMPDGSKHVVKRPKAPKAPKVPRIKAAGSRGRPRQYQPRRKPVRKTGRSRAVVIGSKVVCISMPADQLAALDRFCDRIQMERSSVLRKAWKRFAIFCLGEDEAVRVLGKDIL